MLTSNWFDFLRESYAPPEAIGAASTVWSIEKALAFLGGGFLDYMTTDDHLGLLLISRQEGFLKALTAL
jgi:hypothetical protein